MAKAYQTFQARAYHPDLGNEAIDGSLFFTNRSVTFHGGETVIEIPLHQLVAELDETGEGKLILRDSAQGAWTIFTSDMQVLEHRVVPQITELAESLSSRATRRELSRRAKLVLMFFAGSGLVLWLGMLAMGAMVRSIVAKIPPEMERDFGKGLLEELKADLEFKDDTNEIARLTALAHPLLKTLPPDQSWRFYLISEPSPNAFALPGGHILVTTGLMQLADRPEELLGVVAHEVAHVTQKHGFRQAIASAGPFLIFQIFLGAHGGPLAAVAGGSAFLVHQSFSQEYEKEADDTGWNYLIRANVDPRGMIDVFRKLKLVELAENDVGIMPKAFESHPDIDKRIARLEAKWKRLPRKSGFMQLSAEPQSNP